MSIFQLNDRVEVLIYWRVTKKHKHVITRQINWKHSYCWETIFVPICVLQLSEFSVINPKMGLKIGSMVSFRSFVSFCADCWEDWPEQGFVCRPCNLNQFPYFLECISLHMLILVDWIPFGNHFGDKKSIGLREDDHQKANL